MSVDKNYYGDYAFHEFDTWSPVVSFSAKDQGTRSLFLQQFVNSSIINMNRNYKLAHDQLLSAAPDNVLTKELKATIIKKDAKKIVDSLEIELPKGLYGPCTMEKVVMQKIGYYFKNDGFDYQLVLGGFNIEQIDQDIICDEGIRLICEGVDADEMFDTISRKLNDHLDQIWTYCTKEIATLKLYSLNENYSWGECLDWIEIYIPDVDPKKLNEIIMDWLLNAFLNSGVKDERVEIVFTPARTDYATSIKVNEKTIPSSKYSPLQFSLSNEEVKKILEKNDWEVQGQLYEMIQSHPFYEFPIFLFASQDGGNYDASWCFNIRKDEIESFQSNLSMVASTHFKTCESGIVFLIPTDSKHLGYLLELVQLKFLGKDGVFDCYSRLPLSSMNPKKANS